MAAAVAGSAITESAAGTDHAVLMPADLAAGEGLLVFVGSKNTSGINSLGTLAGCSTLHNAAVGGAFHVVGGIFYLQEATGSEGASLAITTGITEELAAIAYRITGQHASTPPERVAVWASGTSTTPDAPSLTPSWGAAENIWWQVAMGRDPRTWSPNDGDWTENTGGEADSNGEILVCAAHRIVSATSMDPPASLLSGTGDPWAATTVAWAPAAAAAAAAGGVNAGEGGNASAVRGGNAGIGGGNAAFEKVRGLWQRSTQIVRPRLVVPVGIQLQGA